MRRESPRVEKSLKIGDVGITPVIEIDAPVPGSFIVPDATPETLAPIEWLRPHFVTEEGRLEMIVQAFLLEVDGLNVIVDTCVGNDKQRVLPAWNELQLPFLEHVHDAGFPREKVDLVVCTHLHVDHVGWNTMKQDGEWVPTFPNARYIMVKPEFDYWREADQASYGDVFGDSVAPIFDAGLAELVTDTHQITPSLQFVPTPGHTPGHCSLAISSAGEEGVITGDVMHHPCQCAHPEWSSNADVDKPRAIQSRLDFMKRYADSTVQVIGTHWAGPTGVRLVEGSTGYEVHTRST